MLKNREDLHQYFFNEIGNTELDINITEEQKDFLAACSKIIQDQIQNPDFNVEALADVMGMSHSNLYKKIRASSGQSANSFIRFIRLRKAAEILVYTDSLINEAAFASGINDIKYFRKHFTKLFGMQPSAFVKKYRPTFKKKFRLNRS
jgi:AraC-like DNA-binding protein